MAKKKPKVTCPACRAVEWRAWAGKCCKECGAAYAPSTGDGKGAGKNSKHSQESSASAATSAGARPKQAAGFKFATQAILDLLPMDGHLQAFLRVVEGSKDKEALLAAAAPCPGLEEAVTALAELRWPATSPDKECQRELTKAQQEERAAEKALGDARAAAAKAKVQLDVAEAAEAQAAVAFDESKVKAAILAAKLGALKGAEAPASDVAMAPPSSAVILEGELGAVRKLVEAKEAKLRANAAQLELQAAKGTGKGKGSDARAGAEPYTASSAEGDGSTVSASRDLQLLVEDGTKQTAAAKEALGTLESLQKQINTVLAQVKSLASADKGL